MHVSIQFLQSVKRKEKTTIKCFSEGFLSYNLGRAAGSPVFFSFLFFSSAAARFVFTFGKEDKAARTPARVWALMVVITWILPS